MRTFRMIAATCSAAVLACAIPSASVFAAGEHKIVFHLEEAGGDAALSVIVEDGAFIQNAVNTVAYNGNGNTLLYPEPENGKAVLGWTVGKDGTEPFNLSQAATTDLELYPLMTNTVPGGTIALSFDISVLAEGSKLPDNATVLSHSSAAADSPYTLLSAGIYDNYKTYEADNYYIFHAALQPKAGTVIDYSYTIDNRRIFNIDGATVNGEHATVQWDFTGGSDVISVFFPIKLGNPETVTLTLHGNDGTPDKKITVPKSSGYTYTFLDDAAGDRIREKDGMVLDGWCRESDLSGDSMIPDFNSSFFFVDDRDLYARWAELITEVNLTIQTPLCGQVVEFEDSRIEPIAGATPVGDIDEGPDYEETEDDPAAPEVSEIIANEPQITCDVSSVIIDAFWIISDVAPANMTAETEVEYFLDQMIHGENEYLFAISGRRSEGTANPYFSKDLKITINGVTAAEGAGAARIMNTMPKPGMSSSKAGKVTGATTVRKNGNQFVVVGAITADHDWDDGVIKKAADCDTDGEKLYTCRIKDATYSEEIDAYGHHWEDWVVIKAATETEDGLEQRVCDNNGEHKETRIIPKGTRLNDLPGTTTPGSTSDGPKTGDTGADIFLSFGAAATLLAVLSAGLYRKKKKI